jgi:hypothetical protein
MKLCLKGRTEGGRIPLDGSSSMLSGLIGIFGGVGEMAMRCFPMFEPATDLEKK